MRRRHRRHHRHAGDAVATPAARRLLVGTVALLALLLGHTGDTGAQASTIAPGTSTRTAQVGLLSPMSGPNCYRQVQMARTLQRAQEFLNQTSWWLNTGVQIEEVWIDSAVTSTTRSSSGSNGADPATDDHDAGLASAIFNWTGFDSDPACAAGASPATAPGGTCRQLALVGPRTSDEADLLSFAARFLGMPLVSGSATANSLSGRSHFFRTVPTNRFIAQSIVLMIRHFKWDQLSIVRPRSEYGRNMASEIEFAVAQVNAGETDAEGEAGGFNRMRIVADAPFDPDDAHTIEAALDQVERATARVVVLIGSDGATNFMLGARRRGMTGIGWTYIGTEWAGNTELALALPPEEWPAVSDALAGLIGVVPGESVQNDFLAGAAEYSEQEAAACPNVFRGPDRVPMPLELFVPYNFDAVVAVAAGIAEAMQCSSPSSCAVPFEELSGTHVRDAMAAGLDDDKVSPVTGEPIKFGRDSHDRGGGLVTLVNHIASRDGPVGAVATAGARPDLTAAQMNAQGDHRALTRQPWDIERGAIVWPGGFTNVPTDRVSVPTSTQALFFVITLTSVAASTFIGTFLEHKKFFFIPESGVTVLVGVLMGFLLNALGDKQLIDVAEFDEGVFALVLLPVIIFESGYNLAKHVFFKQVGSIALFAVIGTSISVVVVGGGLTIMGSAGVLEDQGWAGFFAFAALISAVDPVATLAIFGALNVDPTLNALVYGESVINDAVSIVMYRTFVAFLVREPTSLAPLVFVGNFVLVFGASMLIGWVIGLMCTFALKVTNLGGEGVLEAGVVLLAAYVSFNLVEGLHLSGIVSVLTTGIVLNHYAQKNLTREARSMVKRFLTAVSVQADSVIFFLVGANLVLFRAAFDLRLSLLTLVLCLIGRALNVFPLAGLANLVRKERIPASFQYVMWHSGLRGAIAYAIGISFPSQYRSEIIGTTSFVIIITIFLFGGSTMSAIKVLGVPCGDAVAEGTHSSSKHDAIEATLKESRVKSALAKFDRDWLRPCLQRDSGDTRRLSAIAPRGSVAARFSFSVDPQGHAVMRTEDSATPLPMVEARGGGAGGDSLHALQHQEQRRAKLGSPRRGTGSTNGSEGKGTDADVGTAVENPMLGARMASYRATRASVAGAVGAGPRASLHGARAKRGSV